MLWGRHHIHVAHGPAHQSELVARTAEMIKLKNALAFARRGCEGAPFGWTTTRTQRWGDSMCEKKHVPQLPSQDAGSLFPIRLKGRLIWKVSAQSRARRRPRRITDGASCLSRLHVAGRIRGVAPRPFPLRLGCDLLPKGWLAKEAAAPPPRSTSNRVTPTLRGPRRPFGPRQRASVRITKSLR